MYPNADEYCDDLDNDCNGIVDDGSSFVFYLDYDSDGYGDPLSVIEACAPPEGYVTIALDCNDLDTNISPSSDEICDEIDNDCDGDVDEDVGSLFYLDDEVGGLFPEEGECALGTSCSDIYNVGLSTGDGVYLIDIDASGSGEEPFLVYCDMANEGWTLGMRFDNLVSSFTFNSSYWTDTQTLDGGNLDPDVPTDGKFVAYNVVQGDEICVCFSGGCKSYPLGQTQSLYALFTDTPIGSDSNNSGGYYFSETSSARLDWLSIQRLSIGYASTSANYLRTGINIDDDMSCYDARVRFGVVINNESTIYTLNDAAGFGASSYYSVSCDYTDTQDAPWSVGAGFAAGGNLYHRGGTIWIR